MTILDNLIEKKDMMAYIDFKIDYLSKNFRKTILAAPKEDREKIKHRQYGKIRELLEFRRHVHDNKIKKMGKIYYQKAKEINL